MVGRRYGGSSITNGVSSVLNQKRRSSRAVTTATSIPSRYSDRNTNAACFEKNVPTSSTYTGRRAEHDMNGLMSTVMMRFERLSMARAAMMAGTLQPNPITRV